jgi:hypothetical protein
MLYAVTLSLEIISQASRQLLDELKAQDPAIARKEIAGGGNVYPTSMRTWRRPIGNRAQPLAAVACRRDARAGRSESVAGGTLH